MFSTSSSECDCAECSRYNAYGSDCNYYGSPFQCGKPPVFSIGPPLIYYAQVQRHRQSRENRKGNCFKKAFKWYTQEHVPAERKVTDISEFATWLDAKYGEYQRDISVNQPTHSHLQIIQTTPTLESCDRDMCDECASKKYERCQSPWKKPKCASKEAGDVIDKPYQSFEFIMRPKEPTRTASECCRTPPRPVKKKSTGNLVSSDTENANKTKIKSQCSSECKNKNLSNKTSAQDNERASGKLITIIMPEAKETKVIVTPKQKPQMHGDEISCQCPETKVVHIDAQTQYYDDLKARNNNDELKAGNDDKCCSANHAKPVAVQAKDNNQSNPIVKANTTQQKNVSPKNIKGSNIMICQCRKEGIKNVDTPKNQSEFGARPGSTPVCIHECEQTGCKKNVPNTNTRPFSILVSDDAQTSDHSINLANETVHGCPLLMKIVHADKLKTIQCF